MSRLEERSLLSTLPANVLSNLGAFISPEGTISGFPTTVVPGETIHFTITIASDAEGPDPKAPLFGYPYFAMSYAENNSILVNGEGPEPVFDQGFQSIYFFPYTPGLPTTPPVEPNPIIRPNDEQDFVLQGPIGSADNNSDIVGATFTGTSIVTATIAPDAPATTITEQPSNFPNLLDATGPWAFLVGEWIDANNDEHTWSTAIPFTVSDDAPVFSTTAGFFGGGGGQTPTASVGAPLSPNVTINVLGPGGGVDKSFNGPVTVTLGGGGAQGATLLGPNNQPVSSIVINAVNGVATLSGANAVMVSQPGQGYTLTASIANGASNPSPAFNVNNHTIKITDPPINGTAGDIERVEVEADSGSSPDAGFSGPIQLQLADANGNPITDPSLFFENAQGQSEGTTISTDASAGVADFRQLFRVDKPGTYTVIASLPGEPGAAPVTSLPFILGTHRISITLPSPMAGGPNEALPTVDVTVEDATGMDDPDYDGGVVLTLHGGNPDGSDNGATLSGNTAQTAAAAATFSNLVINQAGQNYTLTAALTGDPAATPVTSAPPFNVGDTLKFATQPAPPPNAAASSGEPLVGAGNAPVQIDVLDLLGNLDTKVNGTMTLTLNVVQGPGGTAPAPSLLNPFSLKPIPSLTAQIVNGVATPTIVINDTGTYTLTATFAEVGAQPNGTISATSNQFLISHDTPVFFTDPPQDSGENQKFASSVTVDVEKPSGQIDTSYSGHVTLTVVGLSNKGTTPTLGGTTTLQAQNGVATFNGLSVNQLGTGYQLVATIDDGTQSQPSNFFDIVPEVFKVVTQYPDPASVVGDPLNPPLKVMAFLDTSDGTVPDPNFSGPLTLALVQNSAGATLSGGTATASDGAATFSMLSFSKAGTFTVMPSDGNPDDMGVQSAPISIANHTLMFDPKHQPINSVVNQEMGTTIIVDVDDQNGNPDPSFTGTVTLTIDGGQFVDPTTGQPTSSLTVPATAGRGGFPFPVIATAGTFSLTASINEPGSQPATSNSFTVTSGQTPPPAPSGDVNAQYVNQLYQSILGRAPDPGGLNAWTKALDSKAMTPAQVSLAILNSPEHLGQEVDQLYLSLLNRPADPAGRAYWVQVLESGMSEAKVIEDFATSPEFRAKNPTNLDFVEALYEDLLGRAGEPSGVAFWLARLNAGATRKTVAAEFATSAEEAILQVDRDYIQATGHLADPTSAAFWTQVLESKLLTPNQVDAQILAQTVVKVQ